MRLRGLSRVWMSTGSTGGDQVIQLKPPTGSRYYIFGGFGSHNDAGGSRTSQWYLGDGGNFMLMPSVNLAAHAPVSPFALAPGTNPTAMDIGFPLVLSESFYLEWRVFSLAVGKAPYFRLYGLHIRGMEPHVQG